MVEPILVSNDPFNPEHWKMFTKLAYFSSCQQCPLAQDLIRHSSVREQEVTLMPPWRRKEPDRLERVDRQAKAEWNRLENHEVTYLQWQGMARRLFLAGKEEGRWEGRKMDVANAIADKLAPRIGLSSPK